MDVLVPSRDLPRRAYQCELEDPIGGSQILACFFVESGHFDGRSDIGLLGQRYHAGLDLGVAGGSLAVKVG